ncbi:hypothetical protein CUMW_034540 [Citrus unshiu]|nr:hypothetical protein CUMW_034540 [Citrus unshiu]
MQWLNGSVRFSHSVRFIRLLSDSNSRTKLFIGGLSYDTNETVLKDAFGQHGEIIEVKVICDRVTGQSRGYGFVKFASEAAAGEAIKEMDGLKHSSELCAQGLILGLSLVSGCLDFVGLVGFQFCSLLVLLSLMITILPTSYHHREFLAVLELILSQQCSPAATGSSTSTTKMIYFSTASNDATMQQLRLTRSTMQPNHFLNVDRQSFDYISDIIQAAM